eukprot:454688_1
MSSYIHNTQPPAVQCVAMSALIAMAMCDKQNHFMYKHSHNIIAQIKQYYFTNEKLRLMAQSCVQTLATHCTPNIQIINNNSSQLNDISEDKDEDEDEDKDEDEDEDEDKDEDEDEDED